MYLVWAFGKVFKREASKQSYYFNHVNIVRHVYSWGDEAGASANPLALSPRAWGPRIERLTRPVRPHYYVRFEKWKGSIILQCRGSYFTS
jgi:hypothetical protein